MTSICSKGHVSVDSDYCSECGTPITAASRPSQPTSGSSSQASLASPAPAEGDVTVCPMCTTPRSPGAAFCEACRYDFRSKLPFSGLDALPQGNPSAVLEQSGPTAGADAANAAASGFLAAPPNSAAPASQVPAPMPAQATTTLSLRLRVTVDPTLSTVEEQGGACPVGQSDRVFFLDLPENTLGRRNAGGDVHTEIVVDDPGISRRHVRFIVADGQCEVVDLNSANGTHLNEQVLQPGDLKPIKPGDVLTLGFWTRAFVEAR